MPRRSHSSIVWAKSRAVTATSCPSPRRAAISGRITSTCGLLVRSIQTRIAPDGNDPRRRGRECRRPSRARRADIAAIVGRPVLVIASISETLVNETSHFVREAGLPGIFALMAISSACIPLPSEVVMLFAGFAVADPGQSGAQHHLTMVGIVLAGLLGTMVGSWAAYAVGRGGRLELLERHGAKVHMGPAQIERADRWFQRYGEQTVLFGRLVPLVRAFVSLPAGVAKMPLGRFTMLTLIGSLPWVLGLALAGHALGGDWTSVRKGFEYVDYVIVALLVLGAAYALVRRRRRARRAPASNAAG